MGDDDSDEQDSDEVIELDLITSRNPNKPKIVPIRVPGVKVEKESRSVSTPSPNNKPSTKSELEQTDSLGAVCLPSLSVYSYHISATSFTCWGIVCRCGFFPLCTIYYFQEHPEKGKQKNCLAIIPTLKSHVQKIKQITHHLNHHQRNPLQLRVK